MMRKTAVLAILAMALAACIDDTTQPGVPEAVIDDAEQGIYAVFRDARATAEAGTGDVLYFGSGDVTVGLHLVRVDIDAPISSYQGQVEWDAGRLEFLNALVPDGILGSWHEVKPGRVRFAGISVQGLPDGPALLFRFRAREAEGSTELKPVLEEVTGELGTVNLTSRVVNRNARLTWGTGGPGRPAPPG